ncbi:neurochondrin [Spea bombifrons]|uniref:neurochondrin n=1 Tax=Spea bombifrons TaxID=233779 RepID=UPI00234981A0|nr:neurochondrin [Spea bombifrons]
MTEQPEASTDHGSRNSTLDRCLEVLKGAKTDSEQFAALLLVTKCARAGELDDEARHRIFDAVGFSFPNRLLFSKSTPDGCPTHLFRGLGVTLLACFCTVPSLATHPQVLNKIPIFNETVATPCQKDDKDLASMVEDAYQCLAGILASPQGAKHLVSADTVSSLCQAYMNHNHCGEQAFQILTSLLTSMPAKCWKKSRSDLRLLLTKVTLEFSQVEDSRKFQLAEVLPTFLPTSPILSETTWGKECLKYLCNGLFKILGSKLSVTQRDPALKLGACLAHTYGSSWILAETKAERAKCLALLVNLACVEVRMALEDAEPLDSRQTFVTACYSIIEMGVQECIKEEERPLLSEEQKLQLTRVMQEACGSVMHYLQLKGWEKMDDPFTLASVRMLGAWLAEETSCLKKEVLNLLPFLLHYMRTCYQRGVACRSLPKEVSQVAMLSSKWGAVWPGDPIRFLLPGLCHLSAEEAPRRVLISEGAPALLCDYFLQQWEVFSGVENECAENRTVAELSLQSCCGVFLNLVVTEPTLIGQESCFATLMTHLMHCLPGLLPRKGHLVLAANIVTLGVMMGRLLAETPVLQENLSQDFFSSVIQFLSCCHVTSSSPDSSKPNMSLSDDYADVWEEISELWFLGVQAFASCVPLLPWLSSLVLKSGWLQAILNIFEKVSPSSVSSDMVTVLQPLLVELSQNSPACRELVLQQEGIGLANLYGMAALEQSLSETLTTKHSG